MILLLIILDFVSSSALVASSSDVATSSPSCPFTPDPPSTLRLGGDILSFPLSPTSTLSDCAALCCQTSTCQSLTFASPNPTPFSIGGMSCPIGSACCLLKGSPPPLNSSNPYPASMRSAVLALSPGPAPTPPFPASTAISSAALPSSPSLWGDGKSDGDTWPTALLANNRTLAWVCDTTHGPMALMELHGDPYAAALTASLIAPDPLPWLQLCSAYNASRVEDYGNVKPGGMAEVNGTLLVGVACISYGNDATYFIRQHNLAGFLAASTDGGATWGNVTPVGAFAGRFAAPVLTSCGPGLPCPDPDLPGLSWTYVFFTGAANNDASYWESGDLHYLARVAPSAQALSRPSAYQYYAGSSGGSPPRPQWTPDATQAQPVLSFSRMLGQNALHYNAEIGRWLCANYGFVDSAGSPWPWHQLPWHTLHTPRRTQLLLLEAPQPWGPWSVFHREDDFGGIWNGSGAYGTTFPAAFHRPLQPDGTAQVTMLFSCGNGEAGCLYQLNYINVTLSLSAEGVEHAARARAAMAGLQR